MDFVSVRSESVVIHAFPFNSEKKRGGVAVKKVIQKFSLLSKILNQLSSVVWLYDFLIFVNMYWCSGSQIPKFMCTGKGLQK